MRGRTSKRRTPEPGKALKVRAVCASLIAHDSLTVCFDGNLPYDTIVEYRLNGGDWIKTPCCGSSLHIGGLEADTEYDVELRVAP